MIEMSASKLSASDDWVVQQLRHEPRMPGAGMNVRSHAMAHFSFHRYLFLYFVIPSMMPSIACTC